MYRDDRWRERDDERTVAAVADLVVAAAAAAAGLGRAAVGRPVRSAVDGALRLGGRLVLDPAGDPRLAQLALRGRDVRGALRRTAAETVGRLLRGVVRTALATLDPTDLVRSYVDLDALAAGIDVDAVVARADVDAVVARADLDTVVARVDVDAVVARADLDAIVARVDVDAIVARVDIDAIVARVDVDAIVARLDLDAVLGQMDLDALVSRIDLDALVGRVDLDAIASRLDLDAVVDRLDLAGITREVLEAIDLPAVLRESGGAASSQVARVVRAESMTADDSVARFVDRVLRRPRPAMP